MKYRIIKDWYGFKRYRIQRFVRNGWCGVDAGYDTCQPICFWTKWGARRHIRKMRQNGDEPLYIMEGE